MFSPLTRKRFRNFWRIRRARVSLIVLAVLFLISLFAEFVCPFRPNDVTNVAELELFRTVRVSIVPEMHVGRLDVTPDLAIVRPVSCDTFLAPGERSFSRAFTFPDTLRDSLSRRFAGKACDKETFAITPTATGTQFIRSVLAVLPEIPAREKPATARILLRQPNEIAVPFQLRFRRDAEGAPYSIDPKEWLANVPESARTKILNMVSRTFQGEAPIQQFDWSQTKETPLGSVSVSCARDEISWPYPPVGKHFMGFDEAGHDVFAHVIYGMRIAMLFGLLLVVWAIFGGIVFGSLQGYFGGWVDILGQRVTEIWSALPFLYVMIFVGSALGRSFVLLLICYGLFNWIGIAAYMRAEFLRLRHMTFVEAAKCQGLSPRRIIFSHILPNALTPLITLFPFILIGAISSLTALDFLGFGLPPLTPSWGGLLKQAQEYRWAWWLILFPSLALFTVMILSVLVGEGLRDAFDPRQQNHLE